MKLYFKYIQNYMIVFIRFRYFQNVCTFSYSYAWWSWRQWRSHIDWLALNGINLILAPAQEFVWMKTYQKLGLNETESIKVFAGPPFLAWLAYFINNYYRCNYN